MHEPTEKDPAATRAAIMEKLYARGRKKQRTADLDPMDPASYSEIPRYVQLKITMNNVCPLLEFIDVVVLKGL